MEAKQFLKTHSGVVEDALNDYKRWFDEEQENYEEVSQALSDLADVEEIWK